MARYSIDRATRMRIMHTLVAYKGVDDAEQYLRMIETVLYICINISVLAVRTLWVLSVVSTLLPFSRIGWVESFGMTVVITLTDTLIGRIIGVVIGAVLSLLVVITC